jgi:Holliday junction resolvase
MTHPSKQKGNRFERLIVDKAQSYGVGAERAWGSNGRALGMHEEVDVLLEGDLRIQAKCRKKIAEWLKPSEVVDAVVVKEDRGETYIIIRYDEFLDDYKKFLEWKEKEPETKGKKLVDILDNKKNYPSRH